MGKLKFWCITRHLTTIGTSRVITQVIKMNCAELFVAHVIAANVHTLHSEYHVLFCWHQWCIPAMHLLIKYSHSLCSWEIKIEIKQELWGMSLREQFKTYVNNLCRLHACANIPEKLLIVFIPLHRVELLRSNVVTTRQRHHISYVHKRWHDHVGYVEGSCVGQNYRWEIRNRFVSLAALMKWSSFMIQWMQFNCFLCHCLLPQFLEFLNFSFNFPLSLLAKEIH